MFGTWGLASLWPAQGHSSLGSEAGLEPGLLPPRPHTVSQRSKNNFTIYLSLQQQCCTVAITWHLNFDYTFKGSSFWNIWTWQVNDLPSMVRRGYFLIRLFCLPGFCRELCICLSLPPPGSGPGTLLVLPDTHLGSSLCSLPAGLCFHPRSAWWQPTSSSTSGQAQVLFPPICHVGQISLIAK